MERGKVLNMGPTMIILLKIYLEEMGGGEEKTKQKNPQRI